MFYPPKPRKYGFFSGWLPGQKSAGAVKRGSNNIPSEDRNGTYVVAGEVVDRSLSKHGVILELTLPERGGVGGDDNELGLSVTEGLEGRLVSKSDCEQKEIRRYKSVCMSRSSSPFPLFITRANLELMLSPDFFALLGAIVTLSKSNATFDRIEK